MAKDFIGYQALTDQALRGVVRDDETNMEGTADAFEVLHLLAKKRLAAGLRSTESKRFILEQTVLASLVDGRRSESEVAWTRSLATQLGFGETEVKQLELEVANFYKANRDVVDVFTVSRGAEVMGEEWVDSLTGIVRKNSRALMKEIRETGDLAVLLTRAARGQTLDRDEKRRMREQLLDVARAVPALAIFAAPGGFLLLYALAKVLPFDLPSPEKPLSPPIVTMEGASVGYDERVILKRLDLTLSNDDRIGLLGSNGNGKSTFAKLIAGRLQAMGGRVRRSQKLDVGFFAQHQVDDLNPADTPYSAVARLMPDGTEAKIRARCAQLGFPNVKADTKVALLSGGEKARLLMGLATFNGPHLIILDEPTNHLDIDSRAALIEAINDYDGAVILVSHDRHLLEACADRLWLVADGTVKTFDGDMDDYRRFVLDSARTQSSSEPREDRGHSQVEQRRKAAEARRDLAPLRKKIVAAEEKIAKFQDLMARIDAMLAQPDAFTKEPAKALALSQQRSELEKAIAAAEEEWLELTDELESA